jgi:hypothetical protein
MSKLRSLESQGLGSGFGYFESPCPRQCSAGNSGVNNKKERGARLPSPRGDEESLAVLGTGRVRSRMLAEE